MVDLNSLVILCLVRFALAEDRISVDTVGTITATAGYSIVADSEHSPTAESLSSNPDYAGGSSKDGLSSGEAYTPAPGLLRSSQSLALRTRQARGKHNQWQHSGSVEDKDLEITTYPFAVDHRANEQLYSVKPQTFDGPAGQDAKSDESGEKSLVPAVTYGKKAPQTGDGDDDRPAVFGDWSGEGRVTFDGGDKPGRSRKKNAGLQEKRKPQAHKVSDGDSKDGWQEVSPNMEIATGYSATVVQDHDSSQETSGSTESLRTHPIVYHSESSMSSIENAAQVEPQNFNHKQVLSKMNHFDFSNAVSQVNKAPPAREKRLNYLPGGVNGLPAPIRYAFGGGGGVGGQSLKASVQPITGVKSVKIEQPVSPNYHSIVVPIPITHQMYAAINGDSTLASSTMQQAIMSLPVVHNVFFKTDDNGGGKTMPAIVIPLRPEYLHHLQQQQHQYAHHSSDAPGPDSQNAAGHQRPVHHGGGTAGGSGPKTLHYQQQQQQSPSPLSFTPSAAYPQKPKPAKVKKPFGAIKDDQHRVKQPFSLQQHQFYSNPFAGGGGGSGGGGGGGGGPHQQIHGSQPQHLHGPHLQQHAAVQHDSPDDSRYAQTAGAPTQSAVHPFSTAGHSLIVKRPHAYGYASPVAPPKFAANKPPQQQQQMSAEDLATAMVQQQQQQQQPYKATTYHPGFAYLNGPDDDYPYRPIYKDNVKKRSDVLVVRTERRK